MIIKYSKLVPKFNPLYVLVSIKWLISVIKIGCFVCLILQQFFGKILEVMKAVVCTNWLFFVFNKQVINTLNSDHFI